MRRYFNKYNELICYLPSPSTCAEALHTDVTTLIEDLMSSDSQYFDSLCKLVHRIPFYYCESYVHKNLISLWNDFLNRPDAHEFYPTDYPSFFYSRTYYDNISALRALNLTPYQIGTMTRMQWTDILYQLKYNPTDSTLHILIMQGKDILKAQRNKSLIKD